jgi:threonine-phosphate decarboxylase
VPDIIATRAVPAHGGQLRQIAEQFAVPIHELLDFSASIYPDGPPACVLEALNEAIHSPAILRDYPDLDLPELRIALGAYAATPPANILVGNGVAPMIDATLSALRSRRCLLPVPAFGEYLRVLTKCAVKIYPYHLLPELDFRPDCAQLIGECQRQQCDTLLLTNPHNPSGITMSAENMKVIVQRAAENKIRVLLDEAFIDFVPETSLSQDVLTFPNLIVFRSLTKFFSMAGLRVAYLIAPEHMLQDISCNLAHWPVSSVAAMAAKRATEDSTYITATILRNQQEREWLRAELLSLEMTVFPGTGNYLLFRLPEQSRSKSVWERLIVDHRIVVRNCASFEGLDNSYIRVSVRNRADNELLIQALSSYVSSRKVKRAASPGTEIWINGSNRHAASATADSTRGLNECPHQN